MIGPMRHKIVSSETGESVRRNPIRRDAKGKLLRFAGAKSTSLTEMTLTPDGELVFLRIDKDLVDKLYDSISEDARTVVTSAWGKSQLKGETLFSRLKDLETMFSGWRELTSQAQYQIEGLDEIICRETALLKPQTQCNGVHPHPHFDGWIQKSIDEYLENGKGKYSHGSNNFYHFYFYMAHIYGWWKGWACDLLENIMHAIAAKSRDVAKKILVQALTIIYLMEKFHLEPPLLMEHKMKRLPDFVFEHFGEEMAEGKEFSEASSWSMTNYFHLSEMDELLAKQHPNKYQ